MYIDVTTLVDRELRVGAPCAFATRAANLTHAMQAWHAPGGPVNWGWTAIAALETSPGCKYCDHPGKR